MRDVMLSAALRIRVAPPSSEDGGGRGGEEGPVRRGPYPLAEARRILLRPSDSMARLQRYLQIVECRYPQAWDLLAALRRQHADRRSWPAWCYVPLIGARDVVARDGPPRDPTRLVDVAIVGGLAAWRLTRGIYAFERPRLLSLLEQPIDPALPTERLFDLPEFAVYVEVPSPGPVSAATGAMRGVLAHLDHDPASGRAEVRLLIEPTRRWTLGCVPLMPLRVPLTEPTLARCVQEGMRRDVDRLRERVDRFALAGESAMALHALARHSLALIAHLCDPQTSITHPRPPDPRAPERQGDRRPERLDTAVAATPTLWRVG